MDRIQELVDIVLAEFTAMNIGPGVNVPTRTIYLRVCTNGLMWSEVHPAIVWAVEQGGLLTFTPGGIADIGSLALTDAGYQRSRE